jgi:hypothetical protein
MRFIQRINPLADITWSVLALFESHDKANVPMYTMRKHVLLDRCGRSYYIHISKESAG